MKWTEEEIEEYKKKLIEGTNIESSPDEMKVIDTIFYSAFSVARHHRPSRKIVIKCLQFFQLILTDAFVIIPNA